MSRADDFAAIKAANSQRFPLNLSDLTPSGALVNAGDVGAAVPVPGAGRPGWVHVERGTAVGALADVRADFANSPDGPWALNQWKSTDLTGPTTGDGFSLMTGAGFLRIRLGENHTAGVTVTGTVNFG